MYRWITVLIFLLINTAFPQYTGGIGDGADEMGTFGYVGLDGDFLFIMYMGGPGDGHSDTTTTEVLGLNGPISTAFFTGGIGDGFHGEKTQDFYGLNGPIGSYIFTGGTGDGHGKSVSSTYYALSGPISSLFFKGGKGDGFGYTATAGDVSLPVMLSAMEAVAGDQWVELTWVTESEIDNAGFILLRRDNIDTTYREIAHYQTHPELKGAGNSNSRHNYHYRDNFVMNGLVYDYLIVEVDFNGNQIAHGPITATPLPDGLHLSRANGLIPTQPTLLPNYPNPFNPETWITFGIPAIQTDFPTVRIIIYDLLGRPVRRLLENNLGPGFYKLLWDGRSDSGAPLPSGVYLLRFSWNGHHRSRKLILNK